MTRDEPTRDQPQWSQIRAARLLIKMLAEANEPIDEDLWRVAGHPLETDQ